MATETPYIQLYTYFRSSCSARLRIALNLKSLAYEPIPINLLQAEQHSDSHRSLNPSGFVPVLVVRRRPSHDKNNSKPVVITQSLSALEYIEEAFPSTRPLLPPPGDPERRSLVRTLANIVACDIQPVTNQRILKRVKGLNSDATVWARELMEDGFAAFERLVTSSAGTFCVGDDISIADVCLVPAVWSGERMSVEFSRFPVLYRIYETMLKEKAVIDAHWRHQPDTPDEFR